MAAKVKPMTRSLTPKWRAISTAPLMKKFDPTGSNARPIIISRMMGGRAVNSSASVMIVLVKREFAKPSLLLRKTNR